MMKSISSLGFSQTFGHACSTTQEKYRSLKPLVHHTALSALSVCVIMRVAPETGSFMALEVISDRMRVSVHCVLTPVPLTQGHLFKFYSSAATFISQSPLYLIFISLMINNNDENGAVKKLIRNLPKGVLG